MNVADVIKISARSLDEMTVICQTRAGQAYEACMKAMEAAAEECKVMFNKEAPQRNLY